MNIQKFIPALICILFKRCSDNTKLSLLIERFEPSNSLLQIINNKCCIEDEGYFDKVNYAD